MAVVVDKWVGDSEHDAWVAALDEANAVASKFDGWDHVKTGIHANPDEPTQSYTVYYTDYAETLGLAIGEYSNGLITPIIGIVINNEIDSPRGYYGIPRTSETVPRSHIHLMYNNTAMFLGASNTDDANAQCEIYAAKAISQDGNNEITTVLGRYALWTEAVAGYYIYTPTEAEPVEKTLRLQPNANYNCLLPMIGSSAGVASGIYYTLMTEGSRDQIGSVRLNNKTFYIYGTAAIIDYYNN